MSHLYKDLKRAWRMAWMAPGHTTAVVLVLGAGVACATAMFTIVDRVLLHSLPYPNADRIVEVGAIRPPNGDWVGWWSRNHSLATLAFCESGGANLGLQGRSDRVYAAVVSSGFFSIFETNPVLGRAFTKEEEAPAHNHVAILSQHLWNSRFGAEHKVLGASIDLNGFAYTIVGVMPAGFEFPDHVDVWVPSSDMQGALDLGSDVPADVPQRLRYAVILGRLRDGVPLARAQAEQLAAYREYERQFPQFGRAVPQSLRPLEDRIIGSLRTPLLMLFAAVVCVLLIGCANAASLVLSRVAARRHEIAVRACMGAGRGRLARQLLVESLVLSLAGALTGVILAAWCLPAIRAVAPANIPGLTHAGMHWRVLGFALGTAFVTGIAVGLAPALQVFAPDLSRALKDQPGGVTASKTGARIRGTLVACEISLALVLVTGATLMMESLWHLTAVDTGLNPLHALTAEIGVPQAKYRSAMQAAEFYRRLLEQAALIPGVTAAGAIDTLPFGGSGAGHMYFEGLYRQIPGGPERHTVSGDYFRAMGIPLMAGRTFTAADNANAPLAMIINQEFARRIWGNENPVGKRLRLEANHEPAYEVIGVVGDVRSQSLQGDGPDQAPVAQFYLSALQPLGDNPVHMTVVMRTAITPPAAALRKATLTVDHDASLFRVRTMPEVLSQSTAPPRFRAVLLGGFAFLAFSLALLGVYGVAAYTTACRTQEFGLRMALGAQTGDILRLVVGYGLRIAFVGVTVGLGLSLWLMHFLSSLLFGIGPANPLVHVGGALLLTIAVMVATILPARRATRIDPVSALKYE